MASFSSKISFVLLFLLFATAFNRRVVTSNKVIRCNENDQRLLLIFKQGVVDPNNQLSSWTVEQDCCLWEGVYCDDITGRVTELSLSDNALEGEINVCVLRLEFLNHMDLSNNDFQTVSMSLCQISKSPFDANKFHNQSLATPSNQSASFSVALRYLDFSSNFLVINDLHWLSQLSSLKYLDLSDINIGNETKWLQHIAMLPSLSELHLSFCELIDFPSLDYTNFTSLEVLDLSWSYFESNFPSSFFNITNHIYHLTLSGCGFYDQLLKALLNIQNLKHLDLSDNNLEGSIPYWFGQYEQLQYLDIQDNLFSSIIPPSLGNVSSLLSLILSRNQLSGNLPKTLRGLQNLNQLHIGHNFLAGVLSENIFSKFSNLTSLDLSSSSFEFDIDPKWIPPFQLEHLDLGNTSIGPNVPSWLYTQQSLEYLDISRSRISMIDANVFWSFVVGIDSVDISNNLISEDISNVTLSANVYYFDASHNSLSGSIFSLLSQLESNEENKFSCLDLSYNNLSGALPDCWANFENLKYLNLRSNKLTGKVPPSLASSMDLHFLDLSDNRFFGKFSLNMLNWTNLEYLFLEQNEFSGSLPNPMGPNLVVIKLRTNQFVGNIPSQLCNLSYLTILDLAENKLSGSITHCLYKLMPPNIRSFWVTEAMQGFEKIQVFETIQIFTKGRKFHYKFDRTFDLQGGVIDLSANNLSGEIPKELFGISQMQTLNLSQNQLTGKIPTEIGNMTYLESLDLSYNRLSGELPSTISNLSFLDYLNLSYNNFIGQIPLGTQIQSSDSWSFVGNHKLCGDPLPKKCNEKEETNDNSKLSEGNEDDNFLKSLYLGMRVGFAAGFWGVCGSLFLIRVWRHKFFRWFNDLGDRLYVAVALCCKSYDSI